MYIFILELFLHRIKECYDAMCIQGVRWSSGFFRWYKILIIRQNKWILCDILLIQNCCKTIIFQSSDTFIKNAINNYQRIGREYYNRWIVNKLKNKLIVNDQGW